MRTMNIYPKRQYKFKGLLTQTYNLRVSKKKHRQTQQNIVYTQDNSCKVKKLKVLKRKNTNKLKLSSQMI